MAVPCCGQMEEFINGETDLLPLIIGKDLVFLTEDTRRINFCPWCGAELVEWIYDYVEENIDPDAEHS